MGRACGEPERQSGDVGVKSQEKSGGRKRRVVAGPWLWPQGTQWPGGGWPAPRGSECCDDQPDGWFSGISSAPQQRRLATQAPESISPRTFTVRTTSRSRAGVSARIRRTRGDMPARCAHYSGTEAACVHYFCQLRAPVVPCASRVGKIGERVLQRGERVTGQLPGDRRRGFPGEGSLESLQFLIQTS